MQRRRWRQWERQKSNRFRLAKQQLCTSRFFVHFFAVAGKFLISCFVENVNTRQRLSFSFPELWYSLLEFNSGKICQRLTNWKWWNGKAIFASITFLYKTTIVICLDALILLLDLILIGREFQSFAAVTRKVFPPSVSRLNLGQRIVIPP